MAHLISQQRLLLAQQSLREAQVLEQLACYQATVVSTIWLNLDVTDSDIDVLCCYQSKDTFVSCVTTTYRWYPQFEIIVKQDYVVARFQQNGFVIEIYASVVPIEQQRAYQHFVVMERLVAIGGEEFKAKVRSLKQQGLKTEPAIAQLLQLAGDPYRAVQNLYLHPRQELHKLVQRIC